jgi:DNA-binding NarL/FixJ family response regulator
MCEGSVRPQTNGLMHIFVKTTSLGSSASEESVRIFYADDDADDRFLFETALEQVKSNVEIKSFDSGSSLEEALSSENYNCDLVFLDLNMPGKSGLETLQSLQPAIKTKRLKVVVLTTSSDPHVVKKSFDLNAVLFVQKPNDFTELEATLRTIISKRNYFHLPVTFKDFKFLPQYE